MHIPELSSIAFITFVEESENCWALSAGTVWHEDVSILVEKDAKYIEFKIYFNNN